MDGGGLTTNVALVELSNTYPNVLKLSNDGRKMLIKTEFKKSRSGVRDSRSRRSNNVPQWIPLHVHASHSTCTCISGPTMFLNGSLVGAWMALILMNLMILMNLTPKGSPCYETRRIGHLTLNLES